MALAQGVNLQKFGNLPEEVEIYVAPGGMLSLDVTAFDNNWWATRAGIVNAKAVNYNVLGKLTIVSKSTGVKFLEKEFAFGPKTQAEASEEANQIAGTFPPKTIQENQTLVTT